MSNFKSLFDATEEELQDILHEYEIHRIHYNRAISSMKMSDGSTASEAITIDVDSEDDELIDAKSKLTTIRSRIEHVTLKEGISRMKRIRSSSFSVPSEAAIYLERKDTVLRMYDVLQDLVSIENDYVPLRPAPPFCVDDDPWLFANSLRFMKKKKSLLASSEQERTSSMDDGVSSDGDSVGRETNYKGLSITDDNNASCESDEKRNRLATSYDSEDQSMEKRRKSVNPQDPSKMRKRNLDGNDSTAIRVLENSLSENHEKRNKIVCPAREIDIDCVREETGNNIQESHLSRLSDSKFVFRERLRFEHPVLSVTYSNYGTKMNLDTGNQEDFRFIAACGQRNVKILEEALPEKQSVGSQPGRKSLILSMVFKDSDKQEEFNTCVFAGGTFSRPTTSAEKLDAVRLCKGPQYLCVAGKLGTIKVMDLSRKALHGILFGHAGEIMDLKVSPINEWIVVSSSKDETLRIWNLKANTCVAILGGHYGHRGSITAVAWHENGTRILSGGMDTTVKIWDSSNESLIGVAIRKGLGFSNLLDFEEFTGYIKPVIDQFPLFSSNKVHIDFVDCVQFCGDCILSKSCDHRIILWSPVVTREATRLGTTKHPPSSDLIVLRAFSISDDKLWYMRFAIHQPTKTLAVGNTKGEIFLWDIESRKVSPQRLSSHHHSTVRSLEFSVDGRDLMGSADDGSISFWEIRAKS